MATANRSSNDRMVDLVDAMDSDLTAARAIMDAAKILTALERAQAKPVGGALQTGEGFADGHTLRDDTLPALLAHGVDLLNRVEKQSAAVSKVALAPVREAGS